MAIKTFTTGEVLTASDTNTYLNDAGLVLITSGITVSSAGGTAATVSNGEVTIGTNNTSVTVTGAFSATYDAYKIIISSGVGSTSANIGVNFVGSTNNYYSGGAVFSYSSGTQTNIFDNGASSWTRAGQMSADAINMNIELVDPFLAKKTKISWNYALVDTPSAAGFASGFHNVATSYSSFVITPGTGTLTGGKIRVYGYRKA